MANISSFRFVLSNTKNDGQPSRQPMLRLAFERDGVADDVHVLNVRGEADLDFMRALHTALTNGSLAESLAEIGRQTAAAGRTVAAPATPAAPAQVAPAAPDATSAILDALGKIGARLDALESARTAPATNGAAKPAAARAATPAKPATPATPKPADFPF